VSGGGDIATAQLDLIFDTNVLEIPDPATACTVNSRIAPTDATFTFLPQTPSTPAGQARLRLFVGDMNLCKAGLTFPATAISDGPLFTCEFRINPLATPGDSTTLTAQRLNVGDPRGDVFGTTFTQGTVTVQSPSACTADTGCPGGTHCRALMCKGIRPCSGPTAGANECLNGREACINQVCECAGDCNLDGFVRNDELTTLVNVFTGLAPVSSCPETDINGDDLVRNNEVTAVVLNFQQGCQ